MVMMRIVHISVLGMPMGRRKLTLTGMTLMDARCPSPTVSLSAVRSPQQQEAATRDPFCVNQSKLILFNVPPNHPLDELKNKLGAVSAQALHFPSFLPSGTSLCC